MVYCYFVTLKGKTSLPFVITSRRKWNLETAQSEGGEGRGGKVKKMKGKPFFFVHKASLERLGGWKKWTLSNTEAWVFLKINYFWCG